MRASQRRDPKGLVENAGFSNFLNLFRIKNSFKKSLRRDEASV